MFLRTRQTLRAGSSPNSLGFRWRRCGWAKHTRRTSAGSPPSRAKAAAGLRPWTYRGGYDYDRNGREDPILANCSFGPLVQIHCEAFQEGYSLRAATKAEFVDLFEKSIMLIDPCGHIERLGLDKRMWFNRIEAKGTPVESNTSVRFYSYSWHEAAKIALSDKPPAEKWGNLTNAVKTFLGLLDEGFMKNGLRADGARKPAGHWGAENGLDD